MLAAAAAAVLFSLADPQGDARGDGSYQLPAAVEEAAVDLRSFTALDDSGRLQLRLGLGRLSGAGGAPNGFSAPQLDVFIADGGVRNPDLAGTGFTAPAGTGWRYHVSANGWFARVVAAPGAEAPAGEVRARVEGADVVIDTP
ncbi:MAG TPA: glucodextranase DOMON-like domain-containing protein, partial [Deinococcales bacterium]|nr:glucodextranase DOMON-like domain-containing protein [Deinococcales bacterium]